MAKKEEVMDIVAYILEGHNITEAAEHFNTSRKTINKLLDKVRIKEGEFYSRYLAKLIEESLAISTSQIRTLAGQKSRREEVLSEEEIIASIFDIIFENKTTRDLGLKYNCSHTTISNGIKKLNCAKISEIIGDARKIQAKYHGNSTAWQYMIFRWLFSPNMISTIQDEKTINILSQIYELAITSYQFKRRDCEELWTRR